MHAGGKIFKKEKKTMEEIEIPILLEKQGEEIKSELVHKLTPVNKVISQKIENFLRVL